MPEGRRAAAPPRPLGEWSATRHAFHLVYYEQGIAMPSMQQWLGAALPRLDRYDEEAAWSACPQDGGELLREFATVRADQIALLPRFSPVDWDATRETVWGPQTLLWVVSKTFQHTAEHTNDVMRMALFWNAVMEELAERAAEGEG
jgi:hypothetical protein